MKISKRVVLALVMSGTMGMLVAQSQDAKGKQGGQTLEGLVNEWMHLMKERQSVEDKWNENRQILEHTRDGLKSEVEQLNEDIKLLEGKTNRWSEETKEQDELRKKYESAKVWITERLPELEAKALKLRKRFPQSVIKSNVKLASAFEAMEKRAAAESPPKEGMSNRLNRVILVLNEANKFNQTLKVVQEQHEYEGKSMQLTVMYLGFSQAFAANEGMSVGLHGVCTDEGWQFTPVNDQAENIWKSISMAKGEANVEFVGLPVEVR